jgi:hypothetical protein
MKTLVGQIGFVLLSLATGWSLPAIAQEAEDKRAVSVEVQPQEGKLAEPIEIIIRIRAEETAFDFPESLQLDPFTVVDRTRDVELSDEGKLDVLKLKIAAYEETGDLEVPSFKLVSRTEDGGTQVEIEVPAVKVKIVSVLEGIEKPEPRDVSAPVAVIVSDYRTLVFVGLCVFWLLVAFLFRLRRSGAAIAPRIIDLPPEKPAHEIALKRLQQIVDDDLLRQGLAYEYFVRMAEAVREYLGNRYRFFALDLTSRELLEELRDRNTPGLEHAKLQQILNDADLVKFARNHPTDEISSRSIDGAFALVHATKQSEEGEAK